MKRSLVKGIAPWWVGGFACELLWLLLFLLNRQPFLLLSACCLLFGSPPDCCMPS